jgi:hypothetical protein
MNTYTNPINNNISQDILNDLSEEEKNILDTLQSKIKNKLNTYAANVENLSGLLNDPNLLRDDPINPKHITNYEREIAVELRMEMSTINNEGQLIDISQILENHYHIPVPSGVDYLDRITTFINNFDTNLLDCAKKINKQNGTTEIPV